MLFLLPSYGKVFIWWFLFCFCMNRSIEMRTQHHIAADNTKAFFWANTPECQVEINFFSLFLFRLLSDGFSFIFFRNHIRSWQTNNVVKDRHNLASIRRICMDECESKSTKRMRTQNQHTLFSSHSIHSLLNTIHPLFSIILNSTLVSVRLWILASLARRN